MLLAVDTSTKQIGLALFDGIQVVGEMLWQSRQYHTVELAPAVADMLDRTGLAADEIQALGVAMGPGSFTSLRVGLAFMKGLSLSRNLPIIGIPTLDILAAAQELSDRPLAAVLQAGRGRLALGWYQASQTAWQADGSVEVTTVSKLAERIKKPTLVCGELSADERRRLERKRVNVQLSSPSGCVRRPAVLAEMAWERWQAGSTDEAASLAPLYLHTTSQKTS